MKLRDGIVDCPLSGECTLDIGKIVKCWPRTTAVFRNNTANTYRLVNHKAHVKITISEKDGLELIKRLNLVGHKDCMFNVHVFRKE